MIIRLAMVALGAAVPQLALAVPAPKPAVGGGPVIPGATKDGLPDSEIQQSVPPPKPERARTGAKPAAAPPAKPKPPAERPR